MLLRMDAASLLTYSFHSDILNALVMIVIVRPSCDDFPRTFGGHRHAEMHFGVRACNARFPSGHEIQPKGNGALTNHAHVSGRFEPLKNSSNLWRKKLTLGKFLAAHLASSAQNNRPVRQSTVGSRQPNGHIAISGMILRARQMNRYTGKGGFEERCLGHKQLFCCAAECVICMPEHAIRAPEWAMRTLECAIHVLDNASPYCLHPECPVSTR